MRISGIAFLGMGILLFVIGILLTFGVLITNIPMLGYVAWIPMMIGGILIVVGIVLMIIKK